MPVWLALGRIREKPEQQVVFIFTRPRLLFLRVLLERLFCVVPVVANIRLEVMGRRCVLSWKQPRGFMRPSTISFGDLLLEEVNEELLQELQDAHSFAACEGLVFHEEQSTNHREVWAYRDYLPIELAKLPVSAAEAFSHPRRTRKERANTMARELCHRDDRRLRLLCLTWNVGATRPLPSESLEAVLDEEPSPDLCVIGFQETCQLTARRLLADGTEWEAWKKWAEKSVKDAYEGELQLLESAHLVGLLMLVFVRTSFVPLVENTRCTSLGIGVGGYGGNKGAVAVRFELGRSSFCFVNVHLAAGQENYIARCQNYGTIMSKLRFDDELIHSEDVVRSWTDLGSAEAKDPRAEEGMRRVAARLRTQLARMRTAQSNPLAEQTEAPEDRDNAGAEASGGSSRLGNARILDHDHVVWLGDTNSRLHWPGHGGMPLQQARQKVQQRRFGELLALDQLALMRRDRMAFHDFEEHPICFVPSYKWYPGVDAYDMRSQKHVPAWTDRILFRSKTSAAITVGQYSVHSGLKQSDHRLVFASLRAPCDDHLSGKRRQRPTAFGEATTLEVEPKEITFKAAKPDVLMQHTAKLILTCSSGILRQRFEVFFETSLGDTLPLVGMDQSHSGESFEEDDEDGLPSLARWLRVSPPRGVVRTSRPMELSINLRVTGSVLFRCEQKLKILVRVGDDAPERCMHVRLLVRAQLEPSVMRARLEALLKLGRKPLLSEDATSIDRAGPLLPPKEMMSVMQWVLIHSRDMAPGSLVWWSDPLKEHPSRTEAELKELQRHVEHGLTLPRDTTQLSPLSGALFILKCLEVLPEPLLPAILVKDAAGDAKKISSTLRSLPELQRVVLLTVLAFFTQLAVRHGGHMDFTARFVSSLMQAEPAPQPAVQLIGALAEEVKAERSFPPLDTIRRYSN